MESSILPAFFHFYQYNSWAVNTQARMHYFFSFLHFTRISLQFNGQI